MSFKLGDIVQIKSLREFAIQNGMAEQTVLMHSNNDGPFPGWGQVWFINEMVDSLGKKGIITKITHRFPGIFYKIDMKELGQYIWKYDSIYTPNNKKLRRKGIVCQN